jgi:hypothetical protein
VSTTTRDACNMIVTAAAAAVVVVGWAVPSSGVPAGFSITPVVTNLNIPMQLCVTVPTGPQHVSTRWAHATWFRGLVCSLPHVYILLLRHLWSDTTLKPHAPTTSRASSPGPSRPEATTRLLRTR